ncbi:MAG: metal-sensing transcriptional repressor [Eubacteriales bacterium]|nr:metal-sensing transcriptional repressor [Eubacteriales bacterium]
MAEENNNHSHTHVDENGNIYTHVHEEGYAHTHVHENGHVHSHAHGHSHGHNHTHTHDPEHVKSVLNRISRAIGHLESIKRMVEDGRDCSEVLIQLSAVKAAINNTGKVILQDHIEHCLVDAVETGDMETIAELNKAIDRFIK